MLVSALVCSLFMSSCGNEYDAKCEELLKAVTSEPIQTETATNLLTELHSNIDKLNAEQAASAAVATLNILISGQMSGAEFIYEPMYCSFYEKTAKDADLLKEVDEMGALSSFYESIKNGTVDYDLFSDDNSGSDSSDTENYEGEDNDYEVREVAPAE